MPNKKPYFDAVAFLEGLIPATGSKHRPDQPGIFINRTRALLAAVGYQFDQTKFVHLTGTAGKGSVANITYRLLSKNNQKVGLLTSPFVTTTIERIAANGLYIDPLTLAKLTTRLKPAITTVRQNSGFGCPSYFECLLAIALLYFKQEGCRYVIIEAGIGGRYDSTNVIPQPAVTAITNIGLDHTEILGKTLAEIAADKAGIIKTGSQFFTTEKRPKLLAIFKAVCDHRGASYHHIGPISLGAEQANYRLAQAIVKSLGYEALLPLNAIRPLPARFEIMSHNPMVVIDAAHNPTKMRCTALNLATQRYRRCHLVISLSANKNSRKTLKEIVPLVDAVYVTAFRNAYRNATDPKILAETVKELAKPETKIFILPDPIAAFKEARNNAQPEDLILVTGSFYLAGNIRSLYVTEEEILKTRAIS